MRRSSWIALIIAAVLVTVLGILFGLRFDTPAPPMSDRVVRDIVGRGKAAAESKDVNGVMDLFAPDAHVLDIDPERLRPMIQDAMSQLGTNHLDIHVQDVRSRAQNGKGYATVDVDIDEKLKTAAAHYFGLHLTMTLDRVRTSRWLGLAHQEEWKITRLESEPSFGIPAF